MIIINGTRIDADEFDDELQDFIFVSPADDEEAALAEMMVYLDDWELCPDEEDYVLHTGNGSYDIETIFEDSATFIIHPNAFI